MYNKLQQSAEKMSTRPIIKPSLFLLNLCGVDPNKQTFLHKTIATVELASLFFLLLEFGLEFGLNWKGWDSLDAFAPCFAFYQVLFKMVVMVVKRRQFATLFKSFEQFWPWNIYDNDFQNEIDSYYGRITTVMKGYGVAAAVTLSTYFIKPFFTSDKVLPFESYHPTDKNETFNYQLMYAFQTFNMWIAWSSMYGFEQLYVAIIVNLICELKVIKHRFSILKVDVNVSEDDAASLNEIKQLVDHHNLVLDCIKQVNRIYSVPLLNQFLSSLFCITAGLLGTIVSGFPPDMDHFVNFALYMASILGQLFMYCLGGAYLMAETESVAEAVYQSDWWVKSQPKLRKAYVLVLQRAQKTEKLTAGGMFAVDLESYTSILKSSMSFFTLAQALYTKDQ